MKKILLDTNFLLIPYQFRVDIFSEIDKICNFNYEVYVLDKTIGELNGIIKNQSGKHEDAAKFALKSIEVKKIKIVKTEEGRVDDIIVKLAEKEGYIVATQDKDLKRKLVNQGSVLMVLRQKKTLAIMNQGLD